jgi:hypothetical protein
MSVDGHKAVKGGMARKPEIVPSIRNFVEMAMTTTKGSLVPSLAALLNRRPPLAKSQRMKFSHQCWTVFPTSLIP